MPAAQQRDIARVIVGSHADQVTSAEEKSSLLQEKAVESKAPAVWYLSMDCRYADTDASRCSS